MIRAGKDFPTHIKERLEDWRTSLIFRTESDQPSTRGRLQYKDDLGTKTFEYITPVMEVLPEHLKSTKLLAFRSFHLLAEPTELVKTVNSLLELRRSEGFSERPLIIWEPRPSSCNPENKEAFFEASKMVDVLSPNHIEIAKIFGSKMPEIFDQPALEEYATNFIDSGVGPTNTGAVVIRAGAEGCMIKSADHVSEWIPPFYSSREEQKQKALAEDPVVDPTGAGNTFLGSFAIGYLTTKSLTEAALYGNVGASFAVEQFGLPQLQVSRRGRLDVWNGIEVGSRLLAYRNSLYPLR